MKTKITHLLCKHDVAKLQYRGSRGVCPICLSFWDLNAVSKPFHYDDSYPETRLHFEPIIGALKVSSLQGWLKKLKFELGGMTVCEIGFGAGHTLRYLHAIAGAALGVEYVSRNLQHAVELGVPRDRVFAEKERPIKLPQLIDLWIFLDSFEHLPNPAAFMSWLQTNSSLRSRILIVIPRAHSLSERILGRWWPHRIPDHSFHWSLAGLSGFFQQYGFHLERSFFPWKHVSLSMALSHLRLKLIGIPRSKAGLPGWFSRIHVPFNIGEMGLVFVRNKVPSALSKDD